METRVSLCLLICIATGIFAGLAAPVSADTGLQPTVLWNYTMPDDVWTTAFSGDGKYIGAGASDKNLYLFERDGNLLWKKPLQSIVFGVGLSDNADYVAAVDIHEFSTLYLFDHRGNLLWKKPLREPYDLSVLGTAISSDGNRIAVSGYNWRTGDSGIVLLFDRNGNLIWNRTTEANAITVSMSSDGSRIAVSTSGDKVSGGVNNNFVYLFDGSGSVLWKKAPSTWEYCRDAKVSRDGSTIAVTTMDQGSLGKKNIYVYDASGTLLWDGATPWQGGMVAISRDGKYVVAAGVQDHMVHVYDAKGAQLWELQLAKQPIAGLVDGVSISPDGKYIATGNSNNIMYVIENPDAFRQQAVPAQKQTGTAVTGSPATGTSVSSQATTTSSPIDGIVAFFKNLFHT